MQKVDEAGTHWNRFKNAMSDYANSTAAATTNMRRTAIEKLAEELERERLTDLHRNSLKKTDRLDQTERDSGKICKMGT